MAGRIQRKLNSSRGVSMVLALVFFLLCTLVGGAIITAASVSAGKTANERISRQGYLAVVSAAELVEDELRELSFTGAYKLVETVETEVHQEPDGSSHTSVTTNRAYSRAQAETGFQNGGDLIAATGIDLSGCYYSGLGIAELGAAVASDQSCQLSFSPQGEDTLPLVTGTLSISRDYLMTVTLRDEWGESSLTMSYSPRLEKPVVSTRTEVSESGNKALETNTTLYSSTVTWGEPVYSGKGESK